MLIIYCSKKCNGKLKKSDLIFVCKDMKKNSIIHNQWKKPHYFFINSSVLIIIFHLYTIKSGLFSLQKYNYL